MSVSEDFTNIRHKNSYKSCVSRLKALFRVPNFRKKFCHEHIECNLLDAKQCIVCVEVFRKPLALRPCQNFVSRLNALFRDTELLEKSFATNASNLTYSIQNDVWECFGAFRKPSTQKFMKKLCFDAENTISGTELPENVLPRTHPI